MLNYLIMAFDRRTQFLSDENINVFQRECDAVISACCASRVCDVMSCQLVKSCKCQPYSINVICTCIK